MSGAQLSLDENLGGLSWRGGPAAVDEMLYAPRTISRLLTAEDHDTSLAWAPLPRAVALEPYGLTFTSSRSAHQCLDEWWRLVAGD
jgi:hypothetical protein